MKLKSYLITAAIWFPIVMIYANMGGKKSYEGGAIYVGIMSAGAFYTQKFILKWLSNPKTQSSTKNSTSGCIKCNHMTFHFDDFRNEYTCNECGWINTDKPSGNIDITKK
jgi:hypothetical protein